MFQEFRQCYIAGQVPDALAHVLDVGQLTHIEGTITQGQWQQVIVGGREANE